MPATTLRWQVGDRLERLSRNRAVANGMRATDGNTNGTWAGGSIATPTAAGANPRRRIGHERARSWQYTNGTLQNTIGSIVANGATTFGVAPFYAGTQYGPYITQTVGNKLDVYQRAVNEISLWRRQYAWGINVYGSTTTT